MVLKKNTTFIEYVIYFQAKAEPFKPSFCTNEAMNLNPITWWKAQKIDEEFNNIVISLLSASSSSVSIARIFSTFGLVMSKLRNRLGLYKAQKLVFLYRTLRDPCYDPYIL